MNVRWAIFSSSVYASGEGWHQGTSGVSDPDAVDRANSSFSAFGLSSAHSS